MDIKNLINFWHDIEFLNRLREVVLQILPSTLFDLAMTTGEKIEKS